MKDKANHLIDTITLLSFLSLVPWLMYLSIHLALVYLAFVIGVDWACLQALKKAQTKNRQERFQAMVDDFKTNRNYQSLIPALEEASFQLMFCLYKSLGEEEFEQLNLSELSTMKFKIDPKIVKELGLFFKTSQAEFAEVGELEFVGRFLHFNSNQK